MGDVLELANVRRSADRLETGPATIVAFPVIVADRRWLVREAHRIRAGVSGATYRAVADTTRRRLIAGGLPSALAEAEASAACEFVRARVNLFHLIDETGIISTGLTPTGPGRLA